MALIQGRNFTLVLGNAIASPNTTTDFKTALEAVDTNEITFTTVTKEIEIKEPEITTNEVNLLGATSGNQNKELDPQSPTKAEFTATILSSPEEGGDFDFEAFKLTASATKPTGYDFRYNFASAAPSAGVAVVVQANNGSGNNLINWLLNNAVIETLGGVKVDADGHATQEIKVTCSSDDYWKEWDLNGGS